ncbi:ABC transporter ATP-binding protein [Fictibacillus barbaricus]|uniref:ABC transporter ATP-binding protein n=1 Tax=Fictibacillus barbaricus TaxID=182136 RepID=A0ABS2Z9Y5_9BACL|nr:ABC transporter ATP-binding protein [Fictibacillus barbaricus]MBN3544119.1 ABC transporter ATP-binding protein [Fictibacillus barbaricus]GGB69105.1 putative ABC transporter ATP-binding protein YhcH [Fictibacillus barbaricus]
MKKQNSVQIRNLTKVIGERRIVDNISIDIQKGEVFGLLGPNGAGKTTTIRMIVGLISKTNGTVHINGVDSDKEFQKAMKNIGAIVENPEMYKYLTGYENLLHYARMGEDIKLERIEEVAKLVGLDERIHDKVRTYSLGMRQRLGLAQALLRKPTVLILDEPTNGLDPAGIRELRSYLRKLAKEEGVSVIVSSHLLSEMELMCDRVAIIQKGRLMDVRLVSEMITAPSEGTIFEIEVDNVEVAKKILNINLELQALSYDANRINVQTTKETIPDIISYLISAGVKVYTVTPKNHTLEDAFLTMTEGGISHV